MHNGFVTIDGEKMSKSLGNIILVNELTESYHGEVIRLALLSSHYRQGLDWNEKIIHQANILLDKLYEIKFLLNDEIIEETIDTNLAPIAHLADDLNTPGLIAELHKLVKDFNNSHSNKSKIKINLNLISKALGILQDDSYKHVSEELKKQINTLILKRTEAKDNKDYELADKIRNELLDLGVEIKDTSSGTNWNLKS
jgi:cysteinyl-tRNA synthetase